MANREKAKKSKQFPKEIVFIFLILLFTVIATIFLIKNETRSKITLMVWEHGGGWGGQVYIPYLVRAGEGDTFNIPPNGGYEFQIKKINDTLNVILSFNSPLRNLPYNLDGGPSQKHDRQEPNQYGDKYVEPDTTFGYLRFNKKVGDPNENTITVGLTDCRVGQIIMDASCSFVFRIDTTYESYKQIVNSGKTVLNISDQYPANEWYFDIQEYHLNGAIKYEWTELKESLNSGAKHGKLIEKHIYGHPIRELHFNKGKLDGKYTEWHLNGQISITGGYKNDLKDGKWIFYDNQGNLLYSGVFDGGSGSLYYPDNSPKSVVILPMNFTTPKYQTHDESGNVRFLDVTDAVTDGLDSSYTQVILPETIQGGPNNNWILTDKDGSLLYKGNSIIWHLRPRFPKVEKVKKSDRLDSTRTGVWKYWYPNGQFAYEKIFDSTQNKYIIHEWYENGIYTHKVERENIWSDPYAQLYGLLSLNNKHDSLYTAKYRNGGIGRKAFFDDNGFLAKIKHWDSSGALLGVWEYDKGILKENQDLDLGISPYKRGIMKAEFTPPLVRRHKID